MTFCEWYNTFARLAEGVDWPVADLANYRDFYDDEISPEDALSIEISYAQSDGIYS